MSHSVRSTRSPHTARMGRLILCQDFNSQSVLIAIFRASTRQRQKSSLNRHIKSVRTPGRHVTTSRSNSPSCRPIYGSNGLALAVSGGYSTRPFLGGEKPKPFLVREGWRFLRVAGLPFSTFLFWFGAQPPDGDY